MVNYIPETPGQHGRAIEQLFDATFGPGHFAKTAERVREFGESLNDVTRIGVQDDRLIAVCRVWPILVNGVSVLFYGPIAVAPEFQGGKIGQDVTEASLEAGKAAGHDFACLIGAPAYFTRMGFEVMPRGSLVFPGPQDASRVMMRRLAASEDMSFPTGKVSYLLDARKAEEAQKAYLRRARTAG